MPEKMFDQEFVEYVVKSIVDHPDDVTTERIVDEMGTLISLHVNAEDMATIIGKEGRTAKALRTVLRVLGAKHNERINLKIIEPEGGRGFFPAEHEAPTEDSKKMAKDEAPTAEMEPEMPAKAPKDDIDEMSDSVANALKDMPTDEIA